MAGARTRLDEMTAKLAALGLTAQRVEGVDGRALTFPTPLYSAICYKLLHGRRTCPPEVGCYLSHVACAQKLLDSDSDHALILEDDVVFHQDFVEAVGQALKHTQSWDILRLTTVNDGPLFRFRKLTATRSLAIALTREKGSGAYVINRRAARFITTKLVPMRLAYDIAYDLEYLAGLKAAFIEPVCATQDADDFSHIQDNIRDYRLPKWRYITVMPFRAVLETTRLICRSTRLLLAWRQVLTERLRKRLHAHKTVATD